jgi:Diacylglycerol kinase catalytic domain
VAYAELGYLTSQSGSLAEPIPAPVRTCLLVNPRSFRLSRGKLLVTAERLAKDYDVEVLRAQSLHEFHDALDLLRKRRQQRVLVLAGDGTAHAVAQYLAQHQSQGWSPELLFLGGGRANIVPRDGGGYPALAGLHKVLEATQQQRALEVEHMPLLQIEQDGAEPRQGFLFVAAMLDLGVRLCSQHRANGTGWLHRSWVADPYCLLKIGLQVMAGRSPLPPYPRLQIELGDEHSLSAPMRLVMASTLPLRNSLYRPFAQRGEGAVRATAVAANATKFWRRLPAIFGGRFSDQMNVGSGYLSGRSNKVVIHGLDSYSLDGEPVSCHPKRPLRLGAGINLRLIRV